MTRPDEWTQRQAAHDRAAVSTAYKRLNVLCDAHGIAPADRPALIGWAFGEAATLARLETNQTSGRTVGEVALYALQMKLERKI